MGIEPERKFLLANDSWKKDVTDKIRITQRYLSLDPTVRLRMTDKGEAFITVKGKAPAGTIDTPEFEYKIPLSDAEEMMKLCLPGEITKTRYHVPFGGKLWEVDVFEGDNAGLVVAEIELAHGTEAFAKPAWAGDEVTHDKKYKNAKLLLHPYRKWGQFAAKKPKPGKGPKP
ncbi:MAG: CYTH domain-containing protein [Alphaproteobacteria bacterium]|nr:CYTH domain-containing protein [Alphaproteobacteria bacterium]